MSVISKIGLFVIDSLRYDCVGYQQDKRFLKKEDVSDLLDTPTLDKISNESGMFYDLL